MKKMPKEQYPIIFVIFISLINIALTVSLAYGLFFLVGCSRGSIDFVTIFLLTFPIILLVLFFIYLKKLSRQLIDREITSNKFTNMLILSPFLIVFLKFFGICFNREFLDG